MTNRCESFNGLMREYNLHTNRQSSSRDIATRFAVMEQMNFLLYKGVEPGNNSVRSVNTLLHTIGLLLLQCIHIIGEILQTYSYSCKQLHNISWIIQQQTQIQQITILIILQTPVQAL